MREKEEREERREKERKKEKRKKEEGKEKEKCEKRKRKKKVKVNRQRVVSAVGGYIGEFIVVYSQRLVSRCFDIYMYMYMYINHHVIYNFLKFLLVFIF